MVLLVGLAVMAMGQAPKEQEVTFTGAGGLVLHGTLAMPSTTSNRKIPGVVLLPGSGPTDRNGNQLPAVKTDILKQISDELTKNGIATIRFDKRACAEYRPIFMKMTIAQINDFFKWDNFVDDATAAYRFLGSQSNVDPKRLAVLGHSEGAVYTLQIGANLANDPTPPAALVTIGATGRPMGPVIHEQVARGLTKQPEAVKKMYLDYTDKAIQTIRDDGKLPDQEPPPGLGGLFNPAAVTLMQSYFRKDPSDLAAHCKGPVLLINGADDAQVSAERDTPKLKAALEERGSGSVQVLIVPHASHNLKDTSTGGPDAMSGPVAAVALAKIRQFLTKELNP